VKEQYGERKIWQKEEERDRDRTKEKMIDRERIKER